MNPAAARTLIGGLVALGMATVAGADLYTEAEVYRHRLYGSGSPTYASDAATGTSAAAVGPWSDADAYGSITGSASAWAEQGRLGAAAQLTFEKANSDTVGRETFRSWAQASYQERIEIEHPDFWASPGGGLTLLIEFRLTGTVDSNRADPIPGAIKPDYYLDVSELGGGNEEEAMTWQPIATWPSADDGVHDITGSIDVWDYRGSALDLEVTLRVEADNQGLNMGVPYGGTATVDFSGTLVVDNVAIVDDEWDTVVKFDAAGNVLENNSGSGDSDWGLSRTVVPEPMTASLLVLGLLAWRRCR